MKQMRTVLKISSDMELRLGSIGVKLVHPNYDSWGDALLHDSKVMQGRELKRFWTKLVRACKKLGPARAKIAMLGGNFWYR